MWFFRKRKNNKAAHSTYPSFPYHAGELSAYLADMHYFIIALKDGQVIHHYPDDSLDFHNWLVENKIRDVNNY